MNGKYKIANIIRGKLGLKATCVIDTDEERQLIWDALNALEKQIPKRLTGVKIARHGDGLVVTGNCSSCGTYLYQWKNQRKFCQYCGQAIDWSEIE